MPSETAVSNHEPTNPQPSIGEAGENGSTRPSAEAKTKATLDLSSHDMFPSLTTLHSAESGDSQNPEKPKWGGKSASPSLASSPRTASITQVFQMPVEHQRRREATDKRSLAEICSGIGKETGTSVEASRSGQTLAYTFVIKGSEAMIPVARRKIWSVLADTISIALAVPEECLGLVIGPGGRNIKALMELTSTKINIAKPYEGEVVVSGDLEGISLVKQRVEGLIRDKVSKCTKSVSIERHLLPFIFERSPSTKVIGIADEFGAAHEVKITYHLGKEAGSDVADLVISGDKTKVEPALATLEGEITKAKGSIKSVSTSVPKALHRVLIGPKGDSLHALQDESGCYICIPPPEDLSDSILVYGPEGNLLKGLQGILEKTGSLDSQKIHFPVGMKPLFLHLHRSLIRDMETKYNVHISTTDDCLVVDGKKAEVAVSVMELKNKVDTLATHHCHRFEVEPEYIRHIVGKQHRNLEIFENLFKVKLIAENSAILIAASEEENLIKAKEGLARRIQELSDMSSVVLSIEGKFHAALIGAKGANIKEIREEHPNVLIDFVSEDDKVRVRGPSNEVQAVKTWLLKEVETVRHEAVMHSYTADIPLTGEMLKVVTDDSTRFIGPIPNIGREHKVKLTLNKEKTAIVIQGLKKDVETAAVALKDMLSKFADRGSETIQVDPTFHGILIGKNGKNVKHFRQKYDIKLDIPQAGVEEDGDIITIIGPKANLKAAKEEILEFIGYEKEHRHQDSIQVPEEAIPMIVGRGGSRLNEIRAIPDVTRVDLEKTLVVEGMVAISLEGTEAGIAAAKKMIEALLVEYHSTSREVITPDKEAFERLTGAGQGLLQSLIGECGAKGVQIIVLHFDHQFVIRGEKESVAGVKAQLEELLSEKFVKQTVSIPAKFHGSIVGAKGSTINGLQTKHNVAIYLPNSLKRSDTPTDEESVLVEGRLDDVKAACEELLTFIVESETIPMPIAFRSQVVPTLRSQLKALKVRAIDVSEGVKIVGPEESLSKAAQLVRAAVDDLAGRFCVETIEIPLSQHKLIIGKGGAQVDALRKETGCKIVIPPAYARSERIEVQGSPEGVAKAVQSIRNLVLSPSAP